MSIPSQSSIKSPIQLKKSSLLISRICRMIEALTKEERNELREHMDKIDTIEHDPSASNQLNQLLQFRPLVRESVEIILHHDSDNTPPLQNDDTANVTANPFVE